MNNVGNQGFSPIRFTEIQKQAKTDGPRVGSHRSPKLSSSVKDSPVTTKTSPRVGTSQAATILSKAKVYFGGKTTVKAQPTVASPRTSAPKEEQVKVFGISVNKTVLKEMEKLGQRNLQAGKSNPITLVGKDDTGAEKRIQATLVSYEKTKGGKTIKKVALLNLEEKKELGAGGVSIASKVNKCTLSSFKESSKVVKEANIENLTSGGASAEKALEHQQQDVQRHNDIAKMLSKNGPATGIVKPDIQVRDKHGNTAALPISKLYNKGDLYSQLHKLNPGQKLDLFRHISKGIAHMHKLGVYHRDIKPENFFIEEKGGQIKAAISDLGGAVLKSDIKIILDDRNISAKDAAGELLSTMTKLYTPVGDMEELERLVDDHDAGEKDVDIQVATLLEKMDVAATALSMVDVYFGEAADLEPDIQWKGDNSKWLTKELLASGCPGNVTQLIVKMLNPDPNQRPSMKDVVSALSNIAPDKPLPQPKLNT